MDGKIKRLSLDDLSHFYCIRVSISDTLDTKEFEMAELHEELFGNVKPERLPDELFGVYTKPSDFATATALFESRGWETRLAGFSILTSPLYRHGYWWTTENLGDKTIIPQEGLDRLEALDEIGIEYQQIVIAHEVVKPDKKRILEIDWMELGQRTKEAAKTAAIVSVAVIGTVAVVILTGLGHLMLTMPMTLLADPRLIVVLNDPDNPWFEVYKWLD